MRRCAQKQRHDSKSGAITQRVAFAAKLGVPVSKFSVYQCTQCLGWHVGGASKISVTRQRRSGKRPNRRMRGR